MSMVHLFWLLPLAFFLGIYIEANNTNSREEKDFWEEYFDEDGK